MLPKMCVHMRKRFYYYIVWVIIDNSLYILEKIKTKSVLFKRRSKPNLLLNITQNKNVLKQHSVVECLGCSIDENMLGKLRLG